MDATLAGDRTPSQQVAARDKMNSQNSFSVFQTNSKLESMTAKIRTVAIIPARGGSKGIVKKNIHPFCGRPLLEWSIVQAQKATLVDEVYISSDDPDILRCAQNLGAVPIARPAAISGDHSSSESAIKHALEFVSETDTPPSHVVFLQTTSPLRLPDDIDSTIRALLREELDSIFSVTELGDMTLWESDESGLRSVNFDYLDRGRRQDRAASLVENGSIYVFESSVITDYNNRLGENFGVFRMQSWQMWELDNLDDLELMEYLFLKHCAPKRAFDLDLIRHIVFDFDGVLTDNRVLTSESGQESVLCNRSDSLAISILKKRYDLHIISTETNPVVSVRSAKMNVPVIQSVGDKKKVLKEMEADGILSLANTIFVGNDLNDLDAMNLCGVRACPGDAAPEILHIADITFKANGGSGVAAELMRMLVADAARVDGARPL